MPQYTIIYHNTIQIHTIIFDDLYIYICVCVCIYIYMRVRVHIVVQYMCVFLETCQLVYGYWWPWLCHIAFRAAVSTFYRSVFQFVPVPRLREPAKCPKAAQQGHQTSWREGHPWKSERPSPTRQTCSNLLTYLVDLTCECWINGKKVRKN